LRIARGQYGKILPRQQPIKLRDSSKQMLAIIVFRDMVWKVSKLQSGYNELCVYVEPYLTPCTSFVLGLLIFKLNSMVE
jgi:hypothetical protein